MTHCDNQPRNLVEQPCSIRSWRLRLIASRTDGLQDCPINIGTTRFRITCVGRRHAGYRGRHMTRVCLTALDIVSAYSPGLKAHTAWSSFMNDGRCIFHGPARLSQEFVATTQLHSYKLESFARYSISGSTTAAAAAAAAAANVPSSSDMNIKSSGSLANRAL